MKKITKLFILAILLVLNFQSISHADDVSVWAQGEYTKAIKEGLVTYNVISKNLKEEITREEFCELAVALADKLSPAPLETPPTKAFSDCNNTAVGKAYFNGIVSGTSDDLFEPEKLVTRQEMAKMIERTLNSSDVEFDSSDATKLALYNDSSLISDWAFSSVSTMTKYSIMNGTDGYFNPTGTATREQAIITVYRTYIKFKTKESKHYNVYCISPSIGEVINDLNHRISISSIGEAQDYFVVVKDAYGVPVKSMTVSAPSAFRINKSTLPYGEGYCVTVGVKTPDEGQIFADPIHFSFLESEEPIEEPVNTIPEDITPEEVITTPEPEPEPVVIPTIPSKPKDYSTTIGYEDEVLTEKAALVIKEAEKYLGIPYVYGGSTPAGFDCSGFAQYVYRQLGYSIMRVAHDQFINSGKPVERANLQPGDLVFFGTDGYAGHVGIYAGNGQMIHAPSTGKNIMYTSIETNYYVTRYLGAKRIL